MYEKAQRRATPVVNRRAQDPASELLSRCPARHTGPSGVPGGLGLGGQPLVLPVRLCGAAAGNCAHRYLGKVTVCCLLLVQADYIGRAPGRVPEGTGNCSSCYGQTLKMQVYH